MRNFIIRIKEIICKYIEDWIHCIIQVENSTGEVYDTTVVSVYEDGQHFLVTILYINVRNISNICTLKLYTKHQGVQ